MSITALQPAVWRTADFLCSRARIPWRRLMAMMFDPYRPERHYMRGPGPKWHERQDCARQVHGATASTANGMDKQAGPGKIIPHKYCPKCMTLMVLERVVPEFGPLPELRTYKCLRCGCVIDEDVRR